MNEQTISFVLGAFGDVTLQAITKIRGDLVGLKKYFKMHNKPESALIAGGVMWTSTAMYDTIFEKRRYLQAFIFGALLDVIYRYANILPSLSETYYRQMSIPNSMIWGGIPMCMWVWLTRTFKAN